MHAARVGPLSWISLVVLLVACDSKTEDSDTAAKTKLETTKVCNHVVEVLGEPNRAEQVQADCETSLTASAKRHATLTDCILAAGSVEEIEACEESQRYEAIFRSIVPTDHDLCQHVVDVVKADLSKVELSNDEELEVDPAAIEEVFRRCLRDTASDRKRLDRDTFRKHAECMMKIEAFHQLVWCDY